MPFYIKTTMILLMLVLIAAIIFLGRDILVPFSLSILIAILVMPVTNYLQNHRVPRGLAVLAAVLLAFLFILGIIYFLSSQIVSFFNDIEQIKTGINAHIDHLQEWIRKEYGVSFKDQKEMVDQMSSSLKDSGTGAIGSTVSSLKDILLLFSLLPIYTFLILYYRRLIRQFLIDIFEEEHRPKVGEVLKESRGVIQNYMLGLIIEMVIVSAINAVGFLLLGIKYPIFLAVFAAVMNLLPYIGMLIASVFCVAITLTSSPEVSDAFWVLIVLIVVQFIDNNIIMPNVVGSKVKLNALMTILGVLIGGALAGVAGMFLSIPGIAILKIIFDRVDNLKPWGRLLGDDSSDSTKLKLTKKAKAKPEDS
jgi:predicted PurR-regulated permease PerM